MGENSTTTHQALSRRSFIKGTAFVGALAAAGGTIGCSPSTPEKKEATAVVTAPEEQVYVNSCHGNCGRNCAWDVTVRDGYIVNCEPHTYEDDVEDLHRGGCMRGYLNVQRVYDAERLKYPMKRINAKTESEPKWEQITWEEAIDLIAEKWKGIIDEVGPTGIGFWRVWGSSAFMSGYGSSNWVRLKNALGANTIATGADYAQIRIVGLSSAAASCSFDSLRETQTFVFWGNNAAESKWPAWRYANDARENHGAKFYCIDPESTITAVHSDKHIPIKPATDAAFAMSLMQVIFENGWENKEFIQNKTCAPYLVKEDGTCLRESDLGIEVKEGAAPQVYVWDMTSNSAKPIKEVSNPADMAVSGTYQVEGFIVRPTLDLLKERVSAYTPDVCQEITGIDPETTRELAEAMANTHTFVSQDNGHMHYKNSPQTSLAINALVFITGSVGKPGSGVYANYAPGPTNTDWPNTGKAGINIPDNKIHEVAETGMLDGTPVPLKSIFTYSANVIGSASDRSAFERALQAMDFVVIPEYRMTDTCKFADLLLPISHWWERNDVVNSGANTPYFRIAEKAVEPPFECLSDYEIAQRIGEKMGVGQFFQGTDQDQLAEALDSDANKSMGCTYADLQEKKAVKVAADGSINPPDGTFKTENGRLNFFLDRPTPAVNYGQKINFTDYNLPDFVESEVLDSSPLKDKYPLVLLTPHTKYGTQTTFHYAPWLHELIQEPEVHMNPADASLRGLKDGDYVRLFNDRGEVAMRVKLDDGTMPETMVMYHGWSTQYFKKGHYQYLSSHTNSDPLTNNQSYFDVRVQAEAYKEA